MNEYVYDKLQYNELKERLESYCVSGLGKKLVQKLTPSGNKRVVENRLQETTEARKLLDITGSTPLQGITNIDDLLDKIDKDIILNEEQIFHVAMFLRGCRKMKIYMKDKGLEAPTLHAYSETLVPLQKVEEEIEFMIRNNKVCDEASKELKKIRRYIAIAEGKIEEKLNQFLKNSNNKPYIQDFFVSRRHGKLTIPIKAAYKNKIKGTVIESTDKTVFMEIDSVSKYAIEVLTLQGEEAIEEYKILSYLTGLVYDEKEVIKANIEVIGQYDLIFAKGKYSKGIEGRSPKLNETGYIAIKNGKHPLLEGRVVPLNIEMGKDFRSLIITGPNAGGKTVVLKTVGLLTLAMQTGLHIPVAEGTTMSVFDKVFVDIGDNQSLENSLSTFSSHVQNLAGIIKETTQSTLLLFDEIGSGTEPSEGAALAIAILEALYHKGAMIIATTHYNEIKDFSEKHPDFENAAMQFNSETLEPLYKLLIGKAGESNALWISKRMGIQQDILKTAESYMYNKNYNFETLKQSKKRVEKESEEEVKQEDFTKGDRVMLLEYHEEAIVYAPKTLYEPLKVFFKEEIIEVDTKRVKLLITAKELYPEDYNFDLIFKGFKAMKQEKDIARGSKKALKKIQKSMRTHS